MNIRTATYEDLLAMVSDGQRLDSHEELSAGVSDPKAARFSVEPGEPPFQYVEIPDPEGGPPRLLVDLLGDARSRHQEIVTLQRAIEEDPDIRALNLPNLIVTKIPGKDDLPVSVIGSRFASGIVINSLLEDGTPFRKGLGQALDEGKPYPIFQLCGPVPLLHGYWDSFWGHTRRPKVITSTVRVLAIYHNHYERYVSANPLDLVSRVKLSGDTLVEKVDSNKGAKGDEPSKWGMGGTLGGSGNKGKSEGKGKNKEPAITRHLIIAPGGKVMREHSVALQAIRNMKFIGPNGEDFSIPCQRVLLALAMYATTETWEDAPLIRSGCQLVNKRPPVWGLLRRGVYPHEELIIPPSVAKEWVLRACREAKEAGVVWYGTTVLTLSEPLRDAVLKSRDLWGKEDESEEDSPSPESPASEIPHTPAPKGKGKGKGKNHRPSANA